jgi:hypothetical protein
MDTPLIPTSLLIPSGYKAAVHVFSLLVPPAAWTLFNLFVSLQLHTIAPQYLNPISLSISYFILFVFVAFITLIYYALAGGFEWRSTSLPVTRMMVFMVVSGGLLGLTLVAFWQLVRSVLGSVSRLDGVSAMGRLFRVREI